MQEEKTVHTDRRFINVRTGEVIEITGTDAELSKVVTVTATGRHIRPRVMKTTTLKTTYLNKRQMPWKSAYVAVSALPGDHPLAETSADAPAKSVPAADETDTRAPDFDSMTDEEVSAYANDQQARTELAKFLLDKAKKELHRRHPVPRPYVKGDVYLLVSPQEKFDGETAKANLTDEEYASILVPKPDSNRAKALLTPSRYKMACKKHDNKIEIRPASDAHRRKVAELEATLAAKNAAAEAADLEPEDPFDVEDPFAMDTTSH